MSLAHGVLMPGFSGRTPPQWIATAAHTGLAGVVLFAENTPTTEATRALTDALHGLRPDLLVASDEEGGDVTRLQAASGSALPGNAALGEIDDLALTRAVAAAYGRLIALAGIDIALAPCLDVASQPLNPVIGVRSFGADPQLVGRHGAAFVAGLRDAGVAAVGKHFPGHGATTVDSHLDLPVLDVPDALLRARDEQPFVTAAPDAVMTGHLVVPGRGPEPATLSAWASAEIRELGLDGPIITDALGMRAITDRHGIGEACVLALTAGADLLLLDAPHLRDAETDFRAAVSAIEAALWAGRLDAAALARSAQRNATLARPRVTYSADALAAAETELAALGAAAARRALRQVGTVRLAGAPAVVDLRRRLNHASGSLRNPLLTALTAALPGTRAVEADQVSGLAAGTEIVVLTRQPLSDAAEGAALAELLAARPDAIVAHGGLAAAAPHAERLLLMHGVGAANAEAAVEKLVGGR